jgi:hypothetical protein
MPLRAFALRCARMLALCLAGGALSAAAMAQDARLADKVKAAYLFHLTRFVEWPEAARPTLRVCILGSDQVAGLFRELTASKADARSIQLSTEADTDPARCQLLYLGRNSDDIAAALRKVKGRAVLTVSDDRDFMQLGGMVEFIELQGKIKLQVSVRAAKSVDLKLSAKLLEVAQLAPGESSP